MTGPPSAGVMSVRLLFCLLVLGFVLTGSCTGTGRLGLGEPVPGRSYEDFRGLTVDLSERIPLDWDGGGRVIHVTVLDRRSNTRSNTRNRPFLHETQLRSPQDRVFPFGRGLSDQLRDHLADQLERQHWIVRTEEDTADPSYVLSLEILQSTAYVYRKRDFRDVSVAVTVRALVRSPYGLDERTVRVRGDERGYPAHFGSSELEAHRRALQDAVNLALRRMFTNREWRTLLSGV